MAAVSQLIGQGIGFAPGSTKYIPTDGFSIGVGIIAHLALTYQQIGEARLSKAPVGNVALSDIEVTILTLRSGVP